MTPVRRGYVELPHGQVHYRWGGRGPVVVLLHDSPRSSLLHASNIEWLGEHFTVIAPDAPGCGNSTPLPTATPAIEDYAEALAATLTALGVDRCAVYGLHSGAKIALQFAARHAERAPLVLLDGLSLPVSAPAPGFLERYLPACEPCDDGSHLARAWSLLLDMHRWYPWFERGPVTRMASPLPDAQALHDYATDLLVAGPHGSAAYGAALRWMAAPVLPRLRSRVVLMAREGDVLAGSLARLPSSLPADCSVETLPALPAAWRVRLLELMRSAVGLQPAWTPPDAPAAASAAGTRARYVDLLHGQMHVRLSGVGTGIPLLVLPDVPRSASPMDPLLERLSNSRLTILPELPGLGDSDPLPYPHLGAYVTALLEMLQALGAGPVDVLADGLGASFAVALAAHHPAAVRRLVLDGLPVVRKRDRRTLAREYCPPLLPERHGTHLLRAWHQLRDAEASWPWFDRSADAARRREVSTDAHRRQFDLLAIVKALPCYGDASRAALDAALGDILRGIRQPVLLLECESDPRGVGARRAARHLSDVRVEARPAQSMELADRLHRHFA
jgi:pimeloyl-ACP methyl ester carboxylesterase